jgi:hypothetical protein
VGREAHNLGCRVCGERFISSRPSARCGNASASPCCPLVRSVDRRMATSGFLSGRGYYLTRRSFRRTDGRRRSDGEAPRPSATGQDCPGPEFVTAFAAGLRSSPTAAAARCLSDEGRGVLVLRVWDQLPHEVPRRLIHAEGDDSRFSCHSLSSFACGRDRRLNSIRASTVLFMDGSVGRARGERRQPDSERFRSIPRT